MHGLSEANGKDGLEDHDKGQEGEDCEAAEKVVEHEIWAKHEFEEHDGFVHAGVL